MKKLFKILAGLMTCVFLFTGCKGSDSNNDNPTTEGCGGSGDMSLETINEFLNGEDMSYANTVAIIPFNHVNGPREEWKFYALVNFVYRDRAENYVKYQVTYLSCTCRTADVNYWSTAYIEMTIPESGNAEEAELKKLSFDVDGTGKYTAGFWGDSSPIMSGNTVVATYDQVSDGNGGYYPSIKADYIPLLVGKTKAQIDQWNFVDDMKKDGVMSQEMFQEFTGASVSTNNILRILHAVFAYHVDTYF